MDIGMNDLVGETLTHVDTDDGTMILLTTKSGRLIKIYHAQDCCECVGIADTTGEWHTLIGKVIVEAKAETDDYCGLDAYDTGTETKLIFKVDDATVISRWIGTSNGYYSESVDIQDLTKKD